MNLVALEVQPSVSASASGKLKSAFNQRLLAKLLNAIRNGRSTISVWQELLAAGCSATFPMQRRAAGCGARDKVRQTNVQLFYSYAITALCGDTSGIAGNSGNSIPFPDRTSLELASRRLCCLQIFQLFMGTRKCGNLTRSG